jgi:acetyl-CoA carboxylase biotin carboxyl carrier protein
MDQDQVKELRELIELLKANDVAEFDMEQPDFKVRLKFAGEPLTSPAVDLVQLSQMMASAQQTGSPMHATESLHLHPEQSSSAQVASVAEELLHTVKSPIVGTFYESPSPGAPAFIKLGDQVEVGQVLCIIEAMKLMNEIEVDVAGEVVRRIASSGQPVEYGQPLFTIRPR